MNELDLQRTLDNQLVVFHDSTVDRTTNGTGPVATKTLAQLKALDAGYTFTTDGGQTYPYRGRGITIPTIAEAIAQVRLWKKTAKGRGTGGWGEGRGGGRVGGAGRGGGLGGGRAGGSAHGPHRTLFISRALFPALCSISHALFISSALFISRALFPALCSIFHALFISRAFFISCASFILLM